MKTRTLTVVALIASLSGLLLLTPGCAWSIGGGKKETCAVPAQPTQGQQLIDLKKAKDQGVISDDEYEKAKQKILAN